MGGDPLLVERVAKRGGLLRRQRNGLAPASAAVHTFRDADHRVWGVGGIPVEGKYQRVDASLAVEGHRGVSAVLPLEAVATGRAVIERNDLLAREGRAGVERGVRAKVEQVVVVIEEELRGRDQMVRVLRVERQVRLAVVEVIRDHSLANLAVVGGATPNRAAGLDVPHAGIAGGVNGVALKTLRRYQRDCRASGHGAQTQ